MHLKPDPVAVEFLWQFGLLFVLVMLSTLYFRRSGWPRSRRKHSSKHKHKDEPKNDK